MTEIELISTQIIATAGEAKSLYIEAIELAKNRDFVSSSKKIEEGDECFLQCHQVHAQLIQKDAQTGVTPNILLIHAEDQMASCETIKVLAEQIIYDQKQIQEIKSLLEK